MLPRELSTLTFLQYFRLPFNGLRGPLPVWFFEYRQLGDVELQYNQFTGPIPKIIYDKADFVKINLGVNMLSGTISTRIGKLRSLRYISIWGNDLSGTIPTEFGLLHTLCKSHQKYWQIFLLNVKGMYTEAVEAFWHILALLHLYICTLI